MSNDRLWASGAFADAYLERNADAGKDRGPFWKMMLRSLDTVGPFLEVGCGAGGNLQHFPHGFGVDVNADALDVARKRLPTRLNGKPIFHLSVASVAQRLPFVDGEFSVVVTCGTLIHIAPADCIRAVKEVFRVSSKYVLLMEYESDDEEAIEYRGQKAALWKRSWPSVVGTAVGWYSWGKTWSCLLGPDQGFDNVTAYLYEKKQ